MRRVAVVRPAAHPLQEALSMRGGRGSTDSPHLLACQAADQGVLRGTGCAGVGCSREQQAGGVRMAFI